MGGGEGGYANWRHHPLPSTLPEKMFSFGFQKGEKQHTNCENRPTVYSKIFYILL